MSDTPRTDACEVRFSTLFAGEDAMWVPSKKAKEIERELSESNEYSRRLNLKIADLCKERDDWKNIAGEMLGALQMCMTCLKAPPGSAGFIANTETRDMKHWREIVADAMEKHPGVKIDRELYHSLDLPKKQREAFCKSRRKK